MTLCYLRWYGKTTTTFLGDGSKKQCARGLGRAALEVVISPAFQPMGGNHYLGRFGRRNCCNEMAICGHSLVVSCYQRTNAAILAAQLFIFVRRAMAIRGLKTLDIQEVGKDCVTFRADVMEYLVARVDAGAGRRIAGPSNAEAVHAEWARNVDYSNQTRARVVEKFAHRAIAISHLLQLAGIKPPDLWAFDNRAADVAIYIGAVGDLMGRGLLNEARSMDPGHDNRMMVYLG
jgi:hypothetical protein